MMVVDIKPYLWIIDSAGQPLAGATEDLAEWADLRYIEPGNPLPEWEDQPDAILFSAEIEGGASGPAFLQLIEDSGIIPILIITRLRSLGQALAYFRAGAADYLSLPLDSEEVKERVEAALEKHSIDKMPAVMVELESLDGDAGDMTLSIQNLRPVDPPDEKPADAAPSEETSEEPEEPVDFAAAGDNSSRDEVPEEAVQEENGGEEDILAQLSGDETASAPEREQDQGDREPEPEQKPNATQVIELDLFAVEGVEVQDGPRTKVTAGTEIIYKASKPSESSRIPVIKQLDEVENALQDVVEPVPDPLPFVPDVEQADEQAGGEAVSEIGEIPAAFTVSPEPEEPEEGAPIPLAPEPFVSLSPDADADADSPAPEAELATRPAAEPAPEPEPAVAAETDNIYLDETESDSERDYIPEADEEEEPEAVDGLPIPTLWDELPCGLLVFDSASNLVFANTLGMELLGHDNLAALQEALDNGRSSFKAHGLNHKPLPDNQWPQTLAAKTRTARSAVVSIERPDKRRVWLRIDCLPHLHDGKTTRLSMTLVNMTGELPPLPEPEQPKADKPSREAKKGKREKAKARGKRGK